MCNVYMCVVCVARRIEEVMVQCQDRNQGGGGGGV